jgi:predicted Zn-dependent protease
VINPTNPQNLGEAFVTTAVSNAAEEWDKWTKELMNDTYTIDYTATYGVQDYKNAISFGNYPTEGVIAVTTVWYNSATKEIVEFDIMFDTDWTWGDATVDNTKMDLQNIATHEFGHGVGLNDVYDSACSEVTMYGYSDYGETKKRTLEQPDITGLQTLYGV